MKFCILSDLHRDINNYVDFNLSHDPSIFTLIAGDISGIPKERTKWLETQIANGYKGAFVEGNHIVYSDNKQSLDEIQNDLKENYPIDLNSFSYLENNSFIIRNDVDYESVLIIGCTLWTDLKYPTNDQAYNGFLVSNPNTGLNDYRFRCIKCLDSKEYKDGLAKSRWNDGVRNLKWQDTIKFHEESLKYIEETIKKTKNYNKIVVLSHHAPTPLSIDKQYTNSLLTGGYVSNLANFILDNKIDLWVHGHVHSFFDYMIGDCRVVCNPYGYAKHYENVNFKKDFIVEI